MTDKDIIKALEEYSQRGFTFCNIAMPEFARCILALINRQQAEIERLEKETECFADIGKMYSEVRAEAVKEFAESLIMNITINNTNDGYLDYAVDYNCLIEDIQDLVKEMIGE